MNRILLSVCSVFILGSSALAQPATENKAAAGPTSTTESSDRGQQPMDPASPHLGQGTQAEAEHSAEATAHKTVNDSNNQMGTSLQGRTRPVAGSDVGSQNDTASHRGTVGQ